MPDFLLGFVFLCFLICDYTTRHVRCQDTYVYWCKEIRCTIRAFAPSRAEKLNKSENRWINIVPGNICNRSSLYLNMFGLCWQNRKLCLSVASLAFFHTLLAKEYTPGISEFSNWPRYQISHALYKINQHYLISFCTCFRILILSLIHIWRCRR